MADERADLMRREIEAITAPMGTHHAADWLAGRVEALGARRFTWPGADEGGPPPAATLAGMFERAQCPIWWRRQLRRAVVRARESEGMHAGEVCAHPQQLPKPAPRRAAQVYCTDDTVARRMERTKANRAMLEATELEDKAGEIITLAQASDAGTSNKAIRRGELMTRIRGCEEWAEAAGMVGVFTTNTCPSRFHAQTMYGGPNVKHLGATPRDAQAWLCKTWAKARAALQRQAVRFYGFRVAEPHHDGCPHWHMLLWASPAQMAQLQATMRRYWLAEDGDEPGASEHRFKAKTLTAGGAAAYCAKYISKNIDDAGAVAAAGHHDTDHAGQSDWVGIGKAQRVEAWASAWGIRQFQALGQPPVTVWRELRRVEADMAKGAAPGITEALASVHREGERRACWRGYMAAQGGPMVGRDYRIRITRREDERTGRYGDPVAPAPMGVHHVDRPGEVVPSSRREWKPRGTWTAAQREPLQRIPGLGVGLRAFDLPRTSLNNCTPAPRRHEQPAATAARMAPLFAALAWAAPQNARARGGNHHQGPPP